MNYMQFKQAKNKQYKEKSDRLKFDLVDMNKLKG